ncbi:MAG: hypothetical protein ACKPAC_05890, partial [Alphaproteobacteria bacterium]
DQRGCWMRLFTLPLSMLLLLLTLGGCLAGGGHYSPSYSHGYGGYGHRPHHYSYRAFEPPRHHQHSRPLFPHRPIWKKW